MYTAENVTSADTKALEARGYALLALETRRMTGDEVEAISEELERISDELHRRRLAAA